MHLFFVFYFFYKSLSITDIQCTVCLLWWLVDLLSPWLRLDNLGIASIAFTQTVLSNGGRLTLARTQWPAPLAVMRTNSMRPGNRCLKMMSSWFIVEALTGQQEHVSCLDATSIQGLKDGRHTSYKYNSMYNFSSQTVQAWESESMCSFVFPEYQKGYLECVCAASEITQSKNMERTRPSTDSCGSACCGNLQIDSTEQNQLVFEFGSPNCLDIWTCLIILVGGPWECTETPRAMKFQSEWAVGFQRTDALADQ